MVRAFIGQERLGATDARAVGRTAGRTLGRRDGYNHGFGTLTTEAAQVAR